MRNRITCFLSIFAAILVILSHQSEYTYGDEVFLECGVVGASGAYNFTWQAPSGSTSLQRGTIVDYDVTISTLTFEAFAEDTGTYTCLADNSTYSPAETTITVGNAITEIMSRFVVYSQE